MAMGIDAQFKKGVLELSVLHFLAQQDYYGYDLRQQINRFISTTEGAIYPILKRLVTAGYCRHYYKESAEGPARKYYSLNEKGRQYYAAMCKEWDGLVEQVKKLRDLE